VAAALRLAWPAARPSCPRQRLIRNEEVGSSILPGSTTRILLESRHFLRIAVTSPRGFP
jgi:hypothetical protein